MSSDTPVDVFVSYTAADEEWALWVAAVLEAEGRMVVIEAWDAPAGTNRITWISQQMTRASRTVAICSPAYFASHWRTQEWTGALADNTLIPLRVDDCALPPVLATIATRDLHGVDEATAHRRLVEAVGLTRPERRSGGFPGRPAPAPVAVVFPGQLPRGAAGPRVRVGIPPRVADHFQHRPIVDELTRTVDGGGTTVACHVLAGMGGVGKTQLAAHYAHQMWQTGGVDVLVWVVAASREAIHTGYAAAAARICGADPTDPAVAAEVLLDWLAATDTRWLVVLDDLADPVDLAGLWPPTRQHGHVLVTTRRRDATLTGPGRRRIDVGLFTPAQATAYLTAALAAYGRADSPEQIAALATDLGWLPLALSQAAAYLADLDLDCAAYRRRLADHARTLADLTPDTGLPDDQRNTITTAWTLSINRANQLRPLGLARPLLQLAALLDPNGIPETALTSPPALTWLATARPDQPAPTTDDARDALRALHRLSLADHTPAQAVRVHQLLQHAVRDTLTADQTHILARTAADALLHVWPDTDPDGTLTQTLRANTTTLHATTRDHLHQPDLHEVLSRTGNSLGDTGLIGAAINHFQHLCQLAQYHQGPDHPETLVIRRFLAFWQGEAGDHAGAATAFEQLLADQSRVLGPDHPHTLITRHNLACSQGHLGDPAGAATAFEQLLVDRLRVLGPDHPHVLGTQYYLAFWRGEAGDPVGAAAAFEYLLEEYLRVLGPEHPETLATWGNLADWRGEAGDPAGAATAFEHVLEECLRVLGPDHPYTLSSRHNHAFRQGQAGDHAGAATAFERLLADRLRVLGPDHPSILNTRHNLADWRSRAGDPAGAATAFEQLLEECLRVLGPDHPYTLTTRGKLARWRGKAENPAGATAAGEVVASNTAVAPPSVDAGTDDKEDPQRVGRSGNRPEE
ncbi:toll/interleukin-1 receptor domain-containing protein [Frankia sp. R43]|uniref:tetratricopeptide repeat protein n=1 Tax=Frankia sp. R43 TaxID=269536 RepID=UPI0007C87A92|nr:toll/interleukin-1 receptor domain-containing protein [Frankia sp. R43]